MTKRVWFGVQWMKAIRDHGPEDWDACLRSILFVVSTYMDNETGDTSVSQARVAEGAGCRRETVTNKLAKAYAEQDLGRWLLRQKVPTKNGHLRYVCRGLIPPEIQARMALQQGDSDAHGPRDSQAGECDSDAPTPVREAHNNYLGNYLELEPRDLLSGGETVVRAFADNLTPSGWHHAQRLTGGSSQEDILARLTGAQAWELATSEGWFRQPISDAA